MILKYMIFTLASSAVIRWVVKRPLTSQINRKNSPVFSIVITSKTIQSKCYPYILIYTCIYASYKIFLCTSWVIQKEYATQSVTLMKNLLYYWPFFDYDTLDIVSTTSSIRPISIKHFITQEQQIYYNNEIAKALTHKTSRIIRVGANLSVNLDQALHHDLSNLAISQSVLQPITKEDN